MHASAAVRTAAAGLPCHISPSHLHTNTTPPSPSLTPKPQTLTFPRRAAWARTLHAANSPDNLQQQQQQQQQDIAPPPGAWSDASLTDLLVGDNYLTDPDDPLTLLEATDSFDQESVGAPTSTTDEESPYAPEEPLSEPIIDGISGEPALEELLAEGGADLSVERLARLFTFPFDNFQATALGHFVDGKSVVVCAPTGAGKTAIAEAAAAATLARGQRVIYTTPLKALSNQKLFEVRKRFGASRCGLQTGDTSLNTEADIVIMTTEILRNIMYRTAEPSTDTSGASGSTAAPSSSNTREARLGDVGLVVLDEVHYLGDPHRGSVWEEVIINCPRHIQLVCMSATVCNPEDLGYWISKEHQECVTVRTKFRPVPLHWRFAFRNARGVVMENLLDETGKALNPRLSAKEVLLEEARSLLRYQDPSSSSYSYSRGGRRGRGGRAAAAAAAALPWDQQLKNMMESDPEALQRRVNLMRIPTIEGVIYKLQRLQYLPAIWFILSRKDCDMNAIKGGQAMPLTTPEDQALITAEIEALRADQPEAVREKLVQSLINGVASHHAGHLPGWKSMVERLFQRGLCKIVYATGTLAAGLNMPARTTIISALGRKTDDGIKLLPHNELLQMAGRAGRRGFDTAGNCVVLQNRFEGADDAFKIIKAGPESLTSQFKASYGLVLNLLTVYTLDEAKAFVLRSFGNFLQTEGQQLRLQEVTELEAKAKELMEEYQATASADSKELNANAKAARRRLRSLKAESLSAHVRDVVSTLQAAGGLPRKVLLRVSEPGDGPASFAADGEGGVDPEVSGQYVPGVLVEEVEPEDVAHLQPKGIDATPFYSCLGADNRLMQTSAIHVVRVMDGEEGGLDAGDTLRLQDSFQTVRSKTSKAWSSISKGLSTCQVTPGNTSTAKIALKLYPKDTGRWIGVEASPTLMEELEKQRRLYKGLLKQLDIKRKSSNGKDSMATARRLLKRAETVRAGMTESSEGIWMTFKAVMDVLIGTGAMEADTLRLLPLGLLSRSLRVENELWLAMALTHPAVRDLNGPQLAAFLGALISSEVIKRPVTMWDSYSASDQVINVVEALEPTREFLFELQTEAGLSRWNDSLVVDLRLAGLVEAWAAGATWAQIMGDSTLDDGDVARLLMRTSDLLRQVVHTTQLLPQLKEAASEALRGMDRKPVADMSNL